MARVSTRATLRAGLIAALVSGVPSTAHALATGRDPLGATVAAGSLILPGDRSRRDLFLAAIPTHVALSLWWAFLIGLGLPRRRRVPAGAAYGLCIAAVDLGIVGRATPLIRALPAGPQVADHVVFGMVVAALTRSDPDA